jgi:hypothetical protein
MDRGEHEHPGAKGSTSDRGTDYLLRPQERFIPDAAAPLRAELRRVVRGDRAALERIARQAVAPDGHVRHAALPNQLGLVKSTFSGRPRPPA